MECVALTLNYSTELSKILSSIIKQEGFKMSKRLILC